MENERKITKIEAVKSIVLTPQKLKVAAYCRVSTASEEQQTSIEVQKQHYDGYIRSNPDWEFAGMYYENGRSGTKQHNRPELQRMLYDCEHGRIDLILTKSVSRLARNTADCLEIVRRLTELKVHILFEEENLHTGTMDGEFMLIILSSLAESESVSISQNTKWGVKRRFENDTYKVSTPPYGYENFNGKFRVNEKQAEIIRYIFSECLNGRGSGLIAKNLNGQNTNKIWSDRSVRAILSNVHYTGDVIYQKTYTDGNFKRHQNFGEEEAHHKADHHAAIVSTDVFIRAAELIRIRGIEKGNESECYKYQKRYVFSSKIICGKCGSRYKRRIHSKNKNERYIAWGCSNHSRGGGCSMLYIKEESVKTAFITMMAKLYIYKGRIIKPLLADLKTLGQSGFEGDISEISKSMRENNEEVQRLTGLYTNGYLEPAVFKERSNVLQTEYDQLKHRMNQFVRSTSGSIKEIKETEELYKFLCKTDDSFEQFSDDVFDRFVENITVVSPTEIRFNLKSGLSLSEKIER